jgi:hypothetical protein
MVLSTAQETTTGCATTWEILHFMEPEGSLLHSQELFTCTYHEPDQSNQSILSLQDLSYYYLPTYFLVFLVISFPPIIC